MKATWVGILAAAAIFAAPVMTPAQRAQAAANAESPATSVQSKKGTLPANGLDYYYEIHGQGEPLLLLHGGLGSIEMFCPMLPAFAKNRQVIAVDLHGHGRTQLGERKISLIDQGDDMASLLDQLGYAEVDALG